MKMKTALSIVVLLGVSSQAFSAAIPRSSGADPRVQEILYNPNNVTVVKVKEGVATLIQLEEDEFIDGDSSATGMGLGDPMAWNVSVRGNNIFLRPIAEQPDTNIALVTNKRTYAIQLASSNNSEPTYLLRYTYPKKPEPVKQTVFLGKPKIDIPCFDGGKVNVNYQIRGDMTLKPSGIWDNGEFTCLKWNNATDLPVVYRVLPDGKEHLVNYHMEKNVMVVHEVSPQFVLRLGQNVMNVKTNHTIQRGYNYNGTTTGEKLVERK
ncbi:TrbG/VirB9 family P-type conjugative transfer protein [Proteus mirabilis]|uniref:TrbG/VirB9 family P-type conjugative transfer protein n=1 Tax=Proteus mirabilis TaxID=584 RepID=UPI0018C68358|nr:TrbG/VirB9 family P-type conjugative transfer protein [Proteus mirabilis]EMA4642838.1 TrbG/VirB9 family P-type conjugative transfer protein [Proteus mirabilis]MBG5961683.1 TrbG/VirB9 family P-type conjugative transfer protein [Proteus mirabilis]MBL1397075.1 TrbG/VirB9 family P-type conjugative transfer protein [Proteus mirabilis]MBQ0656087.1 TrbG/VirB9 family P-type conjugative transfer protein [Proteus mirabilis]MDL2104992.1 TrbG/VirB9 family P-type conjugative transfer protein [Proteus mi